MATTRILAAPPHTGLLTPREAAHALGVCTYTLTRWARDSQLTAVRTPGGHRRYTYQSVEQTARDLDIPWAVNR